MKAYMRKQALRNSAILLSALAMTALGVQEVAAQRRKAPPRTGPVLVQRSIARALPAGAVRVSIRNQVFYRHGPTFFMAIEGGYQVVPAPVGAVVDVLPIGYEVVPTGSEDLYYHEGVFYRYDPGRDLYLVVEGPEGVAVASLPPGAVEVESSGTIVFALGVVTYRPVLRNGRTVYLIGRRR